MTDTVLIETKGLQKSFGDNHVLKGVDLQIHQGEALAIIGPSGGGKSTFLRCLNLLEEPDGGDVIFEGQKINQKGTDVDKYRQKMGMVFQHFNVFPHMTVKENITLAPVLLKKKTPAEADQKALYLLDRIGLLDKKDEYPRKLSGGQKQRLAIVRALARAHLRPGPGDGGGGAVRDPHPGEGRHDHRHRHPRDGVRPGGQRPDHLHLRRPDRGAGHPVGAPGAPQGAADPRLFEQGAVKGVFGGDP